MHRPEGRNKARARGLEIGRANSVRSYLAAATGPLLFRFGDPAECERTLRAGGFVVVSVTELSIVWPFATPEEVVPVVVASTARLGPMLAMQSTEQRHNVVLAVARKP